MVVRVGGSSRGTQAATSQAAPIHRGRRRLSPVVFSTSPTRFLDGHISRTRSRRESHKQLVSQCQESTHQEAAADRSSTVGSRGVEPTSPPSTDNYPVNNHHRTLDTHSTGQMPFGQRAPVDGDSCRFDPAFILRRSPPPPPHHSPPPQHNSLALEAKSTAQTGPVPCRVC